MESPSSSTVRRPCFVEDDGLASIAGISGFNLQKNLPFMAQKNGLMVRRNSLRNIGSISSLVSSRSGRFLDPRFVEETHSPHFLETCFLCRKPLGLNNDIFMYRGDTPFCSEECRQEQIDTDEASEKKRNLKSFRKIKDTSKSASNSASSSSLSKNYSVRTGAVAAA